MRDLTPTELDGRSIVHQFACSDSFILFSFRTFHQSDMMSKDITWMLFDKRTGNVSVSKFLRNDLGVGDKIKGYALYYKDDHTWIMVDDTLDSVIRLEYLYLR